MVIVYLLIGLFTAILSALPLGASNIAVINTTLKQNAKQAFKIAVTAGLSEVILSYYALHCNTAITTFFEENLWLQTTIAVLLISIGTYLLIKKHTEKQESKKMKLTKSKYTTGFVLGIVNPPVLIYWVVAFGIINNNNIMLSLKSSFLALSLFFIGVYFGKLITLYGYSKMSIVIKNKVKNITTTVNKITGILLICIGFIQAIQLYL
jgi:threonine/homoserine/homoserine lactone efflux protein